MNYAYDKIAQYIIKEYYPKNLKVMAIKYYREATGVGLAEAKDAVEKIFEQYERYGGAAFDMRDEATVTGSQSSAQNYTAKTEIENYIRRNYNENSLIQAIKYYREATGASLASAKPEVEKILGLEEKRAGKTTKNANTGIGVVGCTFILIFGIFMLTAAAIVAIIVPKRQIENINAKVNPISEEEREELLAEGCTEYITDGNYIEKIFWYDTGDRNDTGKKLFIFELKNKEVGYLGVLSKSDTFNYYSDYCRGLAFYYRGEEKLDTVKAKDGTMYSAIIIDREDAEAMHGVPSLAVEGKKKNQVKQSLLLCIPFVISGGFLCVLGGLGIKNRKRS